MAVPQQNHKRGTDWSTLFKRLAAGGLSGCCTKLAIAPLDRTKILLQAQHPYYKDLGIFRCVLAIIRREGVMSLWKGTTMMMIRIFPYSAVQFYSFKQYKSFYEPLIGNDHIAKILSGSSAGVTSVMCTYPLDMVRARLAFQITGEHRYKSISAAFSSIHKQEGGMRGFYRGISATVIGMVPYAGVSFYTFDSLKELCIKHYPDILSRPDNFSPETRVLKPWVSLLCGGFAGAISQTVSFPLDVARRRMQLAHVLPDSHKFKGIWSTLATVYQENGVRRGLYRGLSINYLRVIPQQAIAFSVHEYLLELIGLNRKKD
uniref:graves disease carrier protein n=1 Tax=Ciona intestinalis TaxID=7719 RepID=UPI000180CB2E|nr:graves disease carrier protein [Ciona intestinalis]|eukprot:XP_002130726.3 graves disease carrier protein [Ciona intestinalis]